jgi:hypothetical protein
MKVAESGKVAGRRLACARVGNQEVRLWFTACRYVRPVRIKPQAAVTRRRWSYVCLRSKPAAAVDGFQKEVRAF